VNDLRCRIEALERKTPPRSQVFEDWCRYGDAYHQAAVRGGDLDGALAELKRQLPPCRVDLLIAFIEEAIADYEFRKGETHVR